MTNSDLIRAVAISVLCVMALTAVIFAVYSIIRVHKDEQKLKEKHEKHDGTNLLRSIPLSTQLMSEDIIIPMGRVCIVDVSPDHALNVRADHSAKHPVIGYVENGTIVVVYDITMGWGRINQPSPGWVDMKYLKDVTSAG